MPDLNTYKHSLNFKYPTNRDAKFQSGDGWLDDKKTDDGAEGIWRVHNNLYDVTDFVSKHPGGSMWLELTKGTDITEAYECHHLTTKPDDILKKYLVRPAKTPRNSPFTFEEDGFYRTFKRKVLPILKDTPKGLSKMSNYMIDTMCVGIFAFAILAAYFTSYAFGFISGAMLVMTTNASHNYFHRKDNFRMYYFNLSMMQFREWRISHALSHHLYPNTILDFEITFLEPFIEYLPKKKSFRLKYGTWLYIPLICVTIFHLSYFKRIIQYIYIKDRRPLHWSDILPLTIPSIMYIFTGQSLVYCLYMWTYITIVGSLWFGMIGLNAAHHAPEIFHDGDAPRSTDGIDWGIHQLDTSAERKEINRSRFLVLTAFGDHALHHLFPTLDHAVLERLYPALNETMKDFDVELKIRSQLQMICGQYQQLSRETPNPVAPGKIRC